jgi:hypothetical protein
MHDGNDLIFGSGPAADDSKASIGAGGRSDLVARQRVALQ